MAHAEPPTPSPSWFRVARLALLGTAAAVLASLALNYALLFSDTLTHFGRSVITAFGVPILVGLPLLVFIGLKLEEIRRYRRELTYSTTFDRVTGFFNSTVFSSLVDRRAGSLADRPERGAFLVIDVEHLRDVTLRHGLHFGDEALRLVATTIRSSVRQMDIVGRIGATQFGVFLQGATEANAREVGQRIRRAVSQIQFAPGGNPAVLRATIGGIVFEDDLGFDEMFRSAGNGLASTPEGEMTVSSLVGRDSSSLH